MGFSDTDCVFCVLLQSELNMGGAWERLCTLEKDPFVLSGLMWTWLEQLKEPVISVRDVQKLDLNDSDPANPEAVFKPLDQVSSTYCRPHQGFSLWAQSYCT